jgi:hypothetical protein
MAIATTVSADTSRWCTRSRLDCGEPWLEQPLTNRRTTSGHRQGPHGLQTVAPVPEDHASIRAGNTAVTGQATVADGARTPIDLDAKEVSGGVFADRSAVNVTLARSETQMPPPWFSVPSRLIPREPERGHLPSGAQRRRRDIARSMSRFASRFARSSRLSALRLPSPTPTSSFALPRTK